MLFRSVRWEWPCLSFVALVWSTSIGLELVVLCSGDVQVLRRLRDDIMVGVNGMDDGSARPDVVW